jgi:3-hydroxyacyl-[acyl-carrier-protein] dehydratase
MRFHLIDRIDEVWRWKRITGVKCITLADDVFNEHFPGYPIFPGSLIMEGLAQLAGSFFEMALTDRGQPHLRAVLSIVREFKIRQPAGPGDRLSYTAEIRALQEGFGAAMVEATLDGALCARGELMFTFVKLENEVLSRSRNELYEIVTRNTRFHDETDL